MNDAQPSKKWTKVYDARPGKGDIWKLDGTAYLVRHCGHQTAHWPWYGLTPRGKMILTGGLGLGIAFRYLDDAKVAVEKFVESKKRKRAA